jgi:hypothetical protein
MVRSLWSKVRGAEFSANNAQQKSAMLGMSLGLLAVPGAGEEEAAARGTVVIGENMERLEACASRIAAETFQGTGMEENRH